MILSIHFFTFPSDVTDRYYCIPITYNGQLFYQDRNFCVKMYSSEYLHKLRRSTVLQHQPLLNYDIGWNEPTYRGEKTFR